MKFDMLKALMLNKPGFCLSGAYDRFIGDPTKEGFQVRVKNPQGWPLDIRYMGWDAKTKQTMFFDTSTEGRYGWNSANQVPPGKQSVKLHTGNGGRGNRMFPRIVDSNGIFPIVTEEADSPFQIWLNGQTDLVPHSVNKTRFELHAPVIQNFPKLGDLHAWPVIYYWGERDQEGYETREDLSLVEDLGLVQWIENKLQPDKTYKQSNISISNVLQPASAWHVKDFSLIDVPLLEPMFKGVHLL